MSDTPFLTVMLPVYNGEKYVADAIESVLGQPCRDLELLILNDGSTDATLKIASSYAEKDPRVVVYSHPNMGLGRNRNDGFALVRGRCLAFLDHDDVIVPGFYTDAMRDALGSLFDAGIEVVVPARLHADESLTRGYRCDVPLEGVFPGSGEASLNLPYEFATMLYATDVIERNQIRFYEGAPEMESIFRHKAVFCAERVLFTNGLFFEIRRDNPGQITKNWNVPEVARVRAEQYAKLVEWHRERGTTGVVLDEMARRAQEAQAELGTCRPERVSALQRLRDNHRARKAHKQWLAGMEPLQRYFYAGSPEAEASLSAVIGAILQTAGLQ